MFLNCSDWKTKMPKSGIYTPDQIAWLKDNASRYFICDLAREFNAKFLTHNSKNSIRQRCRVAGILIKPKRFNLTQFEKGKAAYNNAPVGTRRHEKRSGYCQIKTAQPDTWEFLHKLLWKRYHGKEIQKGYTVIFLDGDSTNFIEENLHLVKMTVLLKAARAKLNDYPPELKPSVLAATELGLEINKLANNSNQIKP